MSGNKAVQITNKRKSNLRIDVSNYRTTVQWLLSQLRQDPQALQYSQWCASIGSLYGEIWNQARVKTHFSSLAKELGCDASPKELLFVLQSLYAVLARGVVFYRLDKIQPANYSSIPEVLNCITSHDFYRERWGVHNLLPELRSDGFLSVYDEKEISKAFHPVIRLATSLANQLRDSVSSWANLLTNLYEEIIPRQIRHDLGEYFTPYWLTDRTIEMSGFKGDLNSILLDPGCGSGVFLLAAAEMKYQANKDKSQEEMMNSILRTVVGCDINPLCVLTARLNLVCWLALKFGLPLPNVKIPVLHYDTVFKRPASGQFDDINRVLPDGCDYLVGNPPWISWNSLLGGYRKQIELELLPEYALFDFHGQEAQLGHSNDDYLVTFTLVTIHRYLKEGGLCSFIIKQPLLTNVSGKTFRRFSIHHVRENVRLGVKEVADLRKVNPFGIGNETAIIVLKREDKTVYPVPYETWSKSDGEIVVEKGEAKPSNDRDITSPWVVLTPDLKETEFMEGNCVYEIRHGLKHDVADVLIVRPIERNEDRLVVQRISEDDKEMYEVEVEAVYPFLQPRHISAWKFEGYTYAIIPQRKAGEDNEEKLARKLPLTYKYLERFKDRFTARKSRIFTQKPFYGLFGLGTYTWKPYKVCWCGLGFKPEFVVLSAIRDRMVGDKLPIPDGTIYFIPLDRKEEAHFVCAVLNSELVRKFLSARSGKSKRGLSKKVMEQLSLPRFNPNDNRHLELASWSLKMHQGLKMPDEEGNKIEYLVEEVFRTQREWQQGIFSFVEAPHGA
jgi:adenine-specific DNA-methyltransferase